MAALERPAESDFPQNEERQCDNVCTCRGQKSLKGKQWWFHLCNSLDGKENICLVSKQQTGFSKPKTTLLCCTSGMHCVHLGE